MGLPDHEDGGPGAMIRRTTISAAIGAAKGLSLGLVLAGGLAACQAPAPPPQAAQARSVSVVKVELRPIAGGVVTSGLLIPRNQVQINPDITGYRVAKLDVDEGDWVKAGQPLAEMDASILKAQVDQQLALARQQYETAAQ